MHPRPAECIFVLFVRLNRTGEGISHEGPRSGKRPVGPFRSHILITCNERVEYSHRDRHRYRSYTYTDLLYRMSHLSAHVQANDRARAYRPLHTSTERSRVHPTPLHQGSAKSHHPAASIASNPVIESCHSSLTCAARESQTHPSAPQHRAS